MSEPIPTASPGGSARFSWPIVLGLAVTVVAAAGLLLTARRPAPGPAISREAPAFRLASLDGRQLGPADFRGQVVLLDFWATWCVPCHLQAEILAEVNSAQAGRGVQFLAVSVGEEEATVREFAGKTPFGYPVLLDPASEVADSFEVVALPTIVVLDREGRIVLRESGLVDAATIEKALATALSG